MIIFLNLIPQNAHLTTKLIQLFPHNKWPPANRLTGLALIINYAIQSSQFCYISLVFNPSRDDIRDYVSRSSPLTQFEVLMGSRRFWRARRCACAPRRQSAWSQTSERRTPPPAQATDPKDLIDLDSAYSRDYWPSQSPSYHKVDLDSTSFHKTFIRQAMSLVNLIA